MCGGLLHQQDLVKAHLEDFDPCYRTGCDQRKTSRGDRQGSAKPQPNYTLGKIRRNLERDFNTLPHSNEELRKTIPDALKACETMEGDEDWRDPSDFPEAVLNWFKGQREILFHDKLRATSEEMTAALSHAVSPALGDIGLHSSKSFAESFATSIKC